MDGTLKFWIVIIAVGALNFLFRLSFIAFFSRRSMPPLLARALKYVAAAMLTALVVPMIAGPAAATLAVVNPRVVAALVGGAVAWFTHSTLKTIAAGMGTLWLLDAALS